MNGNPTAASGAAVEPDRTASVTVVIGAFTRRRWDSTRRAVHSALAQSPQPAQVVLVIDHNEPLLRQAAGELPRDVTVIANAYPRGASGTRNTGVEHATTPLVAFLDDDAVARPGWLARLIEPLSAAGVVGTGGGTAPAWQHRRPTWFPEEFNWVVGASYRGMPTAVSTVRNVWSCNMAVRREVFTAVSGFRLGFGKVGDRSRPEDTDLCIRMARATSGRWINVPDAVVDHRVPLERSTLWYFARRCYLEGRGKVELARLLAGAPRSTLDSERDYLLRTIPRGVRRGIADALLRGQPSGLTRAAAILLGVAAAGWGAAVQTVRRPPGRSAVEGWAVSG